MVDTDAQVEEVDRENLTNEVHFIADQLPFAGQGTVSVSAAENPIVFNFEEIGFYVYRRHWDNPSNWYIRQDGSWYFFATRLANFNKSWADTGPTHHVAVDLEYFDDWDDANKVVAGTRIHSIRHHLASVSYRQEIHNYPRTGKDARFAEVFGEIRSARLSSWWLS